MHSRTAIRSPLDALQLYDQQPEANPAKVNILVVDDLREKHLVYRTILEELDQNLIFASSGEEALRHVLNNDFAVILLDVNMPEMDGIETAEMIRKRRKSAGTPIIFLTAFADDVHLAQGYASGAVDYLMTPVMPEILKAKVRVFIELSQMRTRAAQQAEEYARRKAVEESARRKDAFLGMLAHELRNPLAPIRNAIQLLQRIGPVTPDVQELRSIIDRQVTHMSRLVDDLLDVSRVAKGKILLRKEICSFSQVVRNTIEDYRTVFEEKGIRLEARMPENTVWVDGDPTRLVQMVGNILHNAHKFTDAGGNVTVSLVEAAGRARLTVEDSGIGIDPQIMPYIFDVFYQSEQTLDRSRGGLGLGLSLVRNLAEMHNGTIDVLSAGVQQGTAFTLHLPSVDTPLMVVEEPISIPAPKPSSRVLVIEDNRDAAETTRMMLEHEGYEVKTVYSGAEGLAIAGEYNPQAILCDIGLPGMDGYQVVRAMRANTEIAGVFMVALTGYGREEDRRRAIEAGFDLHLTKPFDLNSLKRALVRPDLEKA